MPRPSERKLLIKHLDQILIPAIVNLGFIRFEVTGEFSKDASTKWDLPLGRLKRKGLDYTDLVELQFDKYGRPRFCLIFSRIMEGDFVHWTGAVVPHEDVWAAWSPNAFALYKNPMFMTMFRPRKWPWEKSIAESEFARVAHAVADMTSEIEDALSGRRIGPHVAQSP